MEPGFTFFKNIPVKRHFKLNDAKLQKVNNIDLVSGRLTGGDCLEMLNAKDAEGNFIHIRPHTICYLLPEYKTPCAFVAR